MASVASIGRVVGGGGGIVCLPTPCGYFDALHGATTGPN